MYEHRIISNSTRADSLPLDAIQIVNDAVKDGWQISGAYGVADPIGSTIRHYFILRREKPATKPGKGK